jgi:glutaredoxin-like protein NrdH
MKPRIITLYTSPGCQPCKATKRWLDKRDIPYSEVDITLPENEKDAEAVRALGFKEAPVVIVSTGDPETDLMWSGLVVANLIKYTHSTEKAA